MPLLPCVMLVDDDQTTNFLNQTLLTRLKVTDRLFVARDGADALALLREYCEPPSPNCPALLLLDVNMPGMNGIQFLEAYQHLPQARAHVTVIVMLTTSLHPNDVARVRELNLVADFITKPLTVEKVSNLLRTHFGQELPTS